MQTDKKNPSDEPKSRKPASAQDIKVDTGGSTLGLEMSAWFEVHKKQVLIVGIAALAAVIIGVIYTHWSEQRELAANEALLVLRPPVAGPDRNRPVPSDKYLKVAEEYSSAAAGKRALLLAAEAMFVEGKFDQAKSTFERFLAENPGHVMSPQADLGIAACLEAQGQTKEALTAYDQVRKRYPQDGALSAQARLAMARINESQGNLPQAHTLYRELVEASRAQGYNSWIEEASTRMFKMEKEHPELAAARMAALNPKPTLPTPGVTNLFLTNRATTNLIRSPATNLTIKPATNLVPKPVVSATNISIKPATNLVPKAPATATNLIPAPSDRPPPFNTPTQPK